MLFVTGYAENAAVRGDFLGQGMDMLTKPFALNALGLKVREMLGLPHKAGLRKPALLRGPCDRVERHELADLQRRPTRQSGLSQSGLSDS